MRNQIFVFQREESHWIVQETLFVIVRTIGRRHLAFQPVRSFRSARQRKGALTTCVSPSLLPSEDMLTLFTPSVILLFIDLALSMLILGFSCDEPFSNCASSPIGGGTAVSAESNTTSAICARKDKSAVYLLPTLPLQCLRSILY